MKKIKNLFLKLYRREDGVQFVEYGLLILAVALTVTIAMQAFETDLSTFFGSLLDGVLDDQAVSPQ